MLARKCDRCGRLYEEKSMEIDSERVDAISALEFNGPNAYYGGKKYDLCQGCLEELKNWLENKQEELK